MTTKYDIFLHLAEINTSIKTTDVIRYFKKKKHEYSNIYRLLNQLAGEKLIAKSNKGFQVKLSDKSRLLFDILTFCISNNINYNYIMDKRLGIFISKALIKETFSTKDFDLNPKTFRKYVDILFKYGLLVKLSSKPFKAKITMNYLFKSSLQYYNITINNNKPVKITLIKPIQKEFIKFKRLVKKNKRKYNLIIKEFEIRFIHSSLSLEGNPITLPDTIKILKEEIIPKDLRAADIKEVQNYQNAVDTMITDATNGNGLDQQKILNFHYLSMEHRSEIAGKIRTVPVIIKGNPKFKIAQVNVIRPLLDILMNEYKQFIKKRHSLEKIIEFAAYFHNQFQFIHPFRDGNSRTARLITFHLLLYYDIPVLDIPLGLHDQYLSRTKGYKKRDDIDLSRTLQEIILYNLETINEKLKST